MHFLRTNRQLDNVPQEFIENMGMVNIRPMKAYRLMQELRDTYNIDGGILVTYKNQARKVNCFIGNDDAHMVVDK